MTSSHLCVGSIPTIGNAKDLSQYDPGSWAGRKTPTMTLASINNLIYPVPPFSYTP